MGYEHYITRSITTPEPREAYGRLAIDAMRIVREAKAQGVVVCNWDGTGEPEFTEGSFRLNGSDGVERLPGAVIVGRRESAETFVWEAVPTLDEWDDAERCAQYGLTRGIKTHAYPYDAVVCAILIRAAVHYGDSVRIGSDGYWDVPPVGEWERGTWLPGRALYEATFGEAAERPWEEW